MCDTRIAITATKGTRTDLWDLSWDGQKWSARQDMRQTTLAWLAPTPGTVDPQLAAFSGDALTFGDATIPVASNHNYLDVTSVDFDRDGRATAALSFNDGRGPKLEITKLDDGSTREVATTAGTRLSWGDTDRDPFPDGIAETGTGTRYNLLSNVEAADHKRAIDDRGVATLAKVPSTPDDPSRGALDGLARLAETLAVPTADLLSATTRIVHGTRKRSRGLR